MKATYHNRYGDSIIFEKLDNTSVKMSGFEHARYGINEDGSSSFIDPPGGPFISIGTNLNIYFNTKKDMIVKSIIWDKGNILKIK